MVGNLSRYFMLVLVLPLKTSIQLIVPLQTWYIAATFETLFHSACFLVENNLFEDHYLNKAKWQNGKQTFQPSVKSTPGLVLANIFEKLDSLYYRANVKCSSMQAKS